MKIVIFAGGVGTRLWPLSRKNTPKQFEKIIGDQSTLQLAVQKLFPDFSWEDVYISTNEQYKKIIEDQLPKLPKDNIITEPALRDVGPAVGLAVANFMKTSPNEPMAILWGDHLIRKEDVFRNALKAAEKLVEKDPEKIVFIGQKPRFASQNLGYIEFNSEAEKTDGFPVYGFSGFEYRPHLSTAERFLKDGKHSWNLGYFVATPTFLWKLFEQFAPKLFVDLQKISESVGAKEYNQVLQAVYPQIEKISFDNAILEKLKKENGLVISVDIGWSDIGAWEALKEALAGSDDENVVKGNVELLDSKDSLAFNYNGQLLVGIDLAGMLVINTEDVLLVCPKSSVPKIKKYVESLAGGPNEKFT
ncbi:hypothetical protein A3C26_02035 [Candidatus Daviesbacteria bacterium RIFCSPHIGHO2_02_FULL_39_12]|uniref:Nucleotidyl transferase domain-containing protein n=1 Tax=Candidatus Daviesbacteria bacterium RIFCSPHIGHO2_02_FULL_39_12 TaxID=1797770 RepID=A0A1F5J8X8_9BACT|nr:MAG: hypothetical protein A3C26_02035 [Candidatus Daviesbacteria bacterium RIFCSPHIGHO2_02_FULL_39_12]